MAQKTTREEQARAEIGQTTIARSHAWFLTVFFLTVIFAVPTLQILWELTTAQALAGRRRPQVLDAVDLFPRAEELASKPWSAVNARIRADIHAFEEHQKTNSRLNAAAVPPLQRLLTGVLRAGNESAYCGREGWLFYRPDLDHVMGPAFLDPRTLQRRRDRGEDNPPEPDPMVGILDFKAQLDARGIALLLLPTPVKPTLYPEQFSVKARAPAANLQNRSFAPFIKELKQKGVAVFDPLPYLEEGKKAEAQYLKTDTHWTPAGMQRVARELAESLRPTLPARAPVDYRAVARELTASGDIAALLEVSPEAGVYAAETVRIEEIQTPDGALWRADPGADVLLLGDSFSNIYSLEGMHWGRAAGLAEHLSRELKRPLDALLRNAGGSHATREALAEQMRAGSDRLAGKRLVIWQFAARDLSSGDWRAIALPKPEPGSAATSAGALAESFQIRARVRETSKAPATNAPYSEALTALQVEVLADDGGLKAGSTLIVHAVVLKNRVLQPVALLRAGETVELKLQPWTVALKRQPELERIQMVNTLDDLESPAFWALAIQRPQ